MNNDNDHEDIITMKKNITKTPHHRRLTQKQTETTRKSHN